MKERDFLNGCFSPVWVEKEELEIKQRKDLATLLRELDEIKENIERVAEKQLRLTNLGKFYFQEFKADFT